MHAKTMKALIKSQAGPGLRMDDVPVPECGAADVLIRIRKTGLCGTDLHIYEWDEWAGRTIDPPLIAGHEFVGEVVAVGSHVQAFRVGDRVSGEGHLVCGRCRNCLAGRRHLCAHTQGIGVNRNGAFAEYLSIPVTNVWACHPDISDDLYACFDPLGNAVHTALSFDVLGEDVLITGAGPIGLMAVAGARYAGARHVVITDVNEYRLELARAMGATLALKAGPHAIAEAQRTLKMAEGFDVGLEMSGHAEAFREMLANLCHGGKIALLGILPSDAAIDWNQVVFSGLHIKGVYGREMYETWYKATVMIQGGMNILPVITHHFHCTEYERAFAAMRTGQTGKIVLDWRSDENP